MKSKSLYVYERFPDKIRAIKSLLAEDPEFLDLCEDYHDCIHALRHWTFSNGPESESRFHEYLTLVRELEMEIMQVLYAKP